MKRFCILSLMLATSTVAIAQQENVWAFGKFAGVDFNGSTPVAITTGIDGGNFLEACASVCDENGQLLFYTEGSKVWDESGTLMPNGSNLTLAPPSTFSITGSTSQGTLIVPMPDSSGKYYIFSLRDYQNNGRLSYSVVDMALNSGNGDVTDYAKGIPLDSALTEKMTAVAGTQCNIWLLVSTRSGDIKAYEISAAGINTTPVVSTGVGLGSGLSLEPLGGLAVSPDGHRLAATKMGQISSTITAEVYDFDPATGIVSNPVSLATVMPCFSACFSPDNSKVYIVSSNPAQIYQYDLTAATPSATQTQIGAVPFTTQLKLGPDGKIYFFQPGTTPGLGSINLPDVAGTGCQYATNTILLQTGTQKGFGLPNVVPVIKRDTTYSATTLSLCENENKTLHADSASGWNYEWNNGGTDNSLNISAGGTYWVKYYTSPCILHTDSFYVNAIDLNPIINASGFVLNTTTPYDTYQWLFNDAPIPGATSASIIATQDGDYRVAVTDDESGCADTSAAFSVNGTDIDDVNAISAQINVYPNPAKDIIHISAPIKTDLRITSPQGRLLKEQKQTNTINIRDLASGIYFLHVNDKEGRLIKAVKISKE